MGAVDEVMILVVDVVGEAAPRLLAAVAVVVAAAGTADAAEVEVRALILGQTVRQVDRDVQCCAHSWAQLHHQV